MGLAQGGAVASVIFISPIGLVSHHLYQPFFPLHEQWNWQWSPAYWIRTSCGKKLISQEF